MRLKKNTFSDHNDLKQVADRYSVAVTDEVMAVINTNDPADPIARQYLPSVAELVSTPDELADPIGDDAHSPVKGIVHRYPDRVLLKPLHVCSVYCRFCFRREKVGEGAEGLSSPELQAALDYVRSTPAVWEVIVTGGDPFVLSPRRLSMLMADLNGIDHVKVIRFHTRVPVADPLRVTDELVSSLTSRKAVYVVLHVNHPREITANVIAAVNKMAGAGIPLLSQSTLLKGVNDDAVVLEGLFRKLVENKVKPYYLHHPDKAPGTSHFRLPISTGRALVKQIWGRLSGIAQPSYVLDIPGGFGKVRIDTLEVDENQGGHVAEDFNGVLHSYCD